MGWKGERVVLDMQVQSSDCSAQVLRGVVVVGRGENIHVYMKPFFTEFHLILSRYIFSMLSSVARLAFPATDDAQLAYTYEDNQRIEPEWYCPILPMVLVNGCDGIGTGYSTFVPNYDPREIVANLKRMMNGMEPTDMVRTCTLYFCVQM